MAIIVGEMTGSRKRLGATVYQKGRDGKTVARRYVIPKNPRTNAQMAQRIIFGTVTQASKFMRPIIDHSFEGVAQGAKSINHFAKVNVPILRSLAAADFANKPAADAASVFVTTKAVTALIPNRYQISDGSLSAPRMSVIDGGAGSLALSLGKLPATAVQETTLDAETYYGLTLGQLVRGLFGLNDTAEQLTLCAIARSASDYMYSYNGQSDLGYQIPYCSFNARRLVFKPDTDLSQVIVLLNDDGTEHEDALENIATAIEGCFSGGETDAQLLSQISDLLSSGEITITGTAADGYKVAFAPATSELDSYYIYDIDNGAGHVYAAGVIRSKLVDGSWRRSRAFMQFVPPTANNNAGLIWSISNAAWFRSDTIAESSLFLNEGGSANEVGENF